MVILILFKKVKKKMNDFVNCDICNMKFKQITTLHIKKHKILDIENYKKLFPNSKTISNESHIRRSKIASEINTGRIVTEETREKKRIAMTGKMCGDLNPAKRPEVGRKISEALTGRKQTKEHTENVRLGNLGKPKNFTEEDIERRRNLFKTNNPGFKKGHITWSKGTKGVMKAWNKGLPKEQQPRFGKLGTKESSEKQSKSMIKYLRENNVTILPNIGKNEKEILDCIENELGFEIKRQYKVLNYFVDGYCQELNTVFEIDEPIHLKQIVKDEIREQEISKNLDCNFMRIQI